MTRSNHLVTRSNQGTESACLTESWNDTVLIKWKAAITMWGQQTRLTCDGPWVPLTCIRYVLRTQFFVGHISRFTPQPILRYINMLISGWAKSLTLHLISDIFIYLYYILRRCSGRSVANGLTRVWLIAYTGNNSYSSYWYFRQTMFQPQTKTRQHSNPQKSADRARWFVNSYINCLTELPTFLGLFL